MSDLTFSLRKSPIGTESIRMLCDKIKLSTMLVLVNDQIGLTRLTNVREDNSGQVSEKY
jgi:hypothetical protein